ncbi:MAG: methyltransferase domain-containing protein [Chloroflexi bacterium]|nr:methyltransferase domain-containing protein [Chloroflexota bacterium]
MPWDPVQYEKFKKERAAPFEDLLAMIDVREGMSVIDLGCGPGPLTKRLAGELPGSDVLGIDSSAEMLEQAAEFVRPGLRFEQREIEDIDGEWDLVFTHAAIQWLPGHASLVPRLLSLVRPGGQLAVQLPSNFAHPTHTLIDEVGATEPFRSGLDGFVHRWGVLDIAEYTELLHASGGSGIAIFEKVYPHVLEDADALADWMSGTALVPYMERLPDELHEPFMDAYRVLLRKRFTTKPVFFGFRRILFAASR